MALACGLKNKNEIGFSQNKEWKENLKGNGKYSEIHLFQIEK